MSASAIVVACGLFVLWRERRQRAGARAGRLAGDGVENGAQNALKQMMVWVSWMPGIFCTFSLTKWPMSVA